jgi:hypothetical protein
MHCPSVSTHCTHHRWQQPFKTTLGAIGLTAFAIGIISLLGALKILPGIGALSAMPGYAQGLLVCGGLFLLMIGCCSGCCCQQKVKSHEARKSFKGHQGRALAKTVTQQAQGRTRHSHLHRS